MLPNAELRLVLAMTYPPKPVGFDVVVGGETVAVLTLHSFEEAADRLRQRNLAHLSDIHSAETLENRGVP